MCVSAGPHSVIKVGLWREEIDRRWSVGKKFYIDHTLTPDAETAEEQVAVAHDISSR
jgi:hypothetical protein